MNTEVSIEHAFASADVIDRAVSVLNRAFTTDPDAIKALLSHEVICTSDLSNDPTIQCSLDEIGNMGTVRALGLINGLFGIDLDSERGAIEAVYDGNGDLISFRRSGKIDISQHVPEREKKTPTPERMLRWFRFEHLPPALQDVSRQFANLASAVCEEIEPGPERTVTLRKLLESKDAAVRAKLNPMG